jgi:hypothetical protein
MSRRLIAVLVVALGAVFFVPSVAQGAFGIAEWEALTCNANSDTPAEPGLAKAVKGDPPLPQDPEQCTALTPGKWYRQAAGHPNFGITDFTLNTLTAPGAVGFPDGFVKDIVVSLPEGLGVNPEATPACTTKQAEEGKFGIGAGECIAEKGPGVIVGTNYFTIALEAPGAGCLPNGCENARVNVPVFNVEPFDGVPSMVAFPTTTGVTFIVGDLDPVDQSVTFTISDIEAPPAGPPVIGSRLVFNGRAGNGTYLTMPSNCTEEAGQVTTLHVDSHEGASDTQDFETDVGTTGCASVPFQPGLAVTASGATDSPEPATVDVQMPFVAGGANISDSHLLKANVVLPQGTGLNPSVANGIEVCTDAQFGKGTDNPIACPAASKIGEIEVDTASLDQPLEGDAYIGEPTSQSPSSGNQFRVFLHAFNTRYGVNVRLIGNVFPNPQTGQLTAVVDNNPQAPFTSFRVKINGGPRGALTSPPTCGPNTTTATFTPWSGTAPVTETSAFSLTTDGSGGPCPATLGARKFTPVYTAKSDNTTGGAYSPFRVHIGRVNGEQELRVVNVTLPAGLTAKLAGVPYCSDASLTAAAAASGTAEKSSPSCSSASQIGTVTTEAGTGEPFKLGGKAYLAGPYKGAPLSFAAIAPAVAGPYDLGTVVTRVPLFVNPQTAQVRADSDVIPDVFGGVKTDIRSIDFDVDRSQFMRNPTNCDPKTIAGTINGGGSDPANPAAFSSYPVSAAFQATNCDKLGYKPKLKLRLYGKKASKRRGHPRIEAQLTAREGDANTARTAVTLPAGTLLDNSHFKTICTRVQLAAQQCPKGAQYGNATAVTPLLDNPLQGPVYLVSSSDQLPNLVADLRGQVNIQLRGVITSVKGRMKTTFPEVPDNPVRKFTLKMQGGSKGLLINSKDLCKSKKSRQAKLSMKAQNGKQVKNNKLKINVSCKKKKK